MSRSPLASILLAAALGCGDAPAEHTPPAAQPSALPEEAVPDAQGRVAITVDGMGFHPETVHARVGAPISLVFTRVSEAGCAQELVVPSLGVRRPLPLHRPVVIDVTPTTELRFACGMDMLRGKVVVHGAATH